MKTITNENILIILNFIVDIYVEYMSEPLIEYSDVHMKHLNTFLDDFSTKEQLYLRKKALEIFNFGGFNISCPKEKLFKLKVDKHSFWIKNQKQLSTHLISFPNI